MLVAIACQGDVNFKALLDVTETRCEVVDFVDFSIPSDFGKTWIPIIASRSDALSSRTRRRLLLFGGRAFDPERFFQLVRCFVDSPASFFGRRRNGKFPHSEQSNVGETLDNGEDRDDSGTGAPTLLVLRTRFHPSVHLAFYGRLQVLLNKFIHLYEVMAWLSTLGGAYSAMGDYCDRSRQVAKNITAEQLRLAVEFGDPTLVCRCWIFLALSAMQHGRLAASRCLLEHQWRFAHTKEGSRDPRLKNMIRGVWGRLIYERQLRRQAKFHQQQQPNQTRPTTTSRSGSTVAEC